MILLVNEPPPVPSLVFESVMVGLAVVLQHIPRSVTITAQSPLMLPPENAEVKVIEEIPVVVTVGNTAPAVKEISLP